MAKRDGYPEVASGSSDFLADGPVVRPDHNMSSMDTNLIKLVDAVLRRVLELAADDEPLRQSLRELAEQILSVTEISAPADAELEATEKALPAEEALPAEKVAAAEPAPSASELIKSLWPQITGHQPPEQAETPPPPARAEEPARFDLGLIEQRCRLKAEGTRWAISRQRQLGEGADFRTDIEPADRELISRAKQLQDCFLWMNHSSGPAMIEPAHWEDLAGCFDVVADIMALVRAVADVQESNPDLYEQALDLAAEAQSALRVAVAHVDAPRDVDQRAVYEWLRATAAEQQIFIHRHMRADDPADPTVWEEIGQRCDELDSRFQEARDQVKRRRKRFGKLRYAAGKIQENPVGEEEQQWNTLLRTIDELVADGLQPSNRDMREAILPVIGDLPDIEDIGDNVQLVLREIDRFLAGRPSGEPRSATVEPTEEIRQATELLAGRSVVIIGGDRRPHAEEALRKAFKLQELIWVATREHESVTVFESYVARPEVAVVLLAIRWSSHSYGEVRQFCEQYGKPLVRLPGGYNPNQVAVQLMEQCGSRLKAAL